MGQRWGVEEGLPIKDKFVLQILRLVLQRFTDPNEKFAGMTYGQLRLEWQPFCEHFGWDIRRYTLYCMRCGGATRHYKHHRDMTETCLLGRLGCNEHGTHLRYGSYGVDREVDRRPKPESSVRRLGIRSRQARYMKKLTMCGRSSKYTYICNSISSNNINSSGENKQVWC